VIEQLSVQALRRYYGPDRHQYGDLHVSRADPERGILVLFHGGFWRSRRDLSMTTPMAQALANIGWNVWNVEYRRGDGTGWEQTTADCAAALDHVSVLAEELSLETRTVVVAGHSAGGHLAATASRTGTIAVSGLVTLNGVLDLRTAVDERIGDNAVLEFLGASPESSPSTFRRIDPAIAGPLGVPAVCLHSRSDERVPFALTESFVRAARKAGDDVRLVEIPGAHTAPIEVGSETWPAVEAAIGAFVPARGR
jgi:acetyl esterase/lipase